MNRRKPPSRKVNTDRLIADVVLEAVNVASQGDMCWGQSEIELTTGRKFVLMVTTPEMAQRMEEALQRVMAEQMIARPKCGKRVM